MVALLATAILLAVLLRRSFRQRRRYRWQSEHDGLTRLYNYQKVRKLGGVAFARARATGRPFTAIVVDIDLFKQVNDRYGHAAGDEALRSLGAWIRETVDGRGRPGEHTSELQSLMRNSYAVFCLTKTRTRLEAP